jgi:hypothetical protein
MRAKVAYDMRKGIRVLKAEIFKLSDWQAVNCWEDRPAQDWCSIA